MLLDKLLFLIIYINFDALLSTLFKIGEQNGASNKKQEICNHVDRKEARRPPDSAPSFYRVTPLTRGTTWSILFNGLKCSFSRRDSLIDGESHLVFLKEQFIRPAWLILPHRGRAEQYIQEPKICIIINNSPILFSYFLSRLHETWLVDNVLLHIQIKHDDEIS